MAVPPDILAALQGGGPAPMGGPEAIPPDMLAALGGGEAPEGGMHGGAVAPGDPEDHYREALDHLELGVKADTDEARIQTVLQCIAKVQGELANSQKGMDSMLGGKMDPATMRRMGSAEQAY